MGMGIVRVSHELMADFFTVGVRDSFAITEGLPDDAKLFSAVFHEGHIAFYFKHSSFGICDDVDVVHKKFYPTGGNNE